MLPMEHVQTSQRVGRQAGKGMWTTYTGNRVAGKLRPAYLHCSVFWTVQDINTNFFSPDVWI